MKKRVKAVVKASVITVRMPRADLGADANNFTLDIYVL
jgi:hypothetical protein